jgi:hypothetical protein
LIQGQKSPECNADTICAEARPLQSLLPSLEYT